MLDGQFLVGYADFGLFII